MRMRTLLWHAYLVDGDDNDNARLDVVLCLRCRRFVVSLYCGNEGRG